MKMEAGNGPSETAAAVARWACDQCHARKVRCDRLYPCSNCRISNIPCRFSRVRRKRSERRRHVTISEEYEKKIDLLQDRLGGIEQYLHAIGPNSSSSSPAQIHRTSTVPEPTTPSPTVSTGQSTVDPSPGDPVFEGDSSITAQSAYAAQFVDTAFSAGAMQAANPNFKSALQTLKEICTMDRNQSSSREVHFPNRRTLPMSGLRGLQLPPLDVVLTILRRIKVRAPSCFWSAPPHIPVSRFTELCREVYFCTEDYSDATFILVNGKLYHIFLEYSSTSDTFPHKGDYKEFSRICRDNLETALSHLPLLIPARRDSVEALVLGAVHAVELSKPSLAWMLTSAAAQLCQSLGYHRSTSMRSDNSELRESKLHLFWSTYILDRNLSLRLGRTSGLRDHDISLPQNLSTAHTSDPWRHIFSKWVDVAKIQGKVYDNLYSPTAFSMPLAERASRARQLASEMECIIAETSKTDFEFDENSPALYIYRKSDEVNNLSLMTLIYRAIPTSDDWPFTFVTECVETARRALDSHHECMGRLEPVNDILKCSYVHWTVLQTPFVPFMVIFCYVIEASDIGDLRRLENFTRSLEGLCALSNAVARLHYLCRTFILVAQLYLEVNTSGQEDRTLSSARQEVGRYLSTIGLIPSSPRRDINSQQETTELPMVALPRDGSDFVDHVAGSQGNELANWFSGNLSMMGLLEEDLFQLDPDSSIAW